MYNLFRNRRKRTEKKREKLEDCLNEIARILSDRYSVNQIVVFGSYVQDSFDVRSDLDIAVDQIDSDQYLSALADISRLLPETPVDLIDLSEEGIPESFKRSIRQEGEIIYEQC